MPQSTKKWPMPTKELIALGEGARISLIALKAIGHEVKKLHVWIDSMTVYLWIANPAVRLGGCVIDGIDKIIEMQQKFKAIEYHYVHTKQNPADIESRSIEL